METIYFNKEKVISGLPLRGALKPCHDHMRKQGQEEGAAHVGQSPATGPLADQSQQGYPMPGHTDAPGFPQNTKRAPAVCEQPVPVVISFLKQ